MTKPITAQSIDHLKGPLENHPLYGGIRTISHLRLFMEHHVYSVWDFMSLIKYLQSIAAPVRYPWRPHGDPSIRRFINELVMEEESDKSPSDEEGQTAYFSHFELYCQAMEEIGADTAPVLEFIRRLEGGVQTALEFDRIPAPSKAFTRTTFRFIESGKPHVAAAALALGREHIIPAMFRALLGRIGVTESRAPRFFLYLNRHIQIDQDFHAPLSLKLLNALCGDDAGRRNEAMAAAGEAVRARISFWDGVQEALERCLPSPVRLP